MGNKGQITQLLLDAGNGNSEAFNRLFSQVYDELGYMAQNQLAGYESDLRKTELIHELYLRLIDQTQTDWRDRSHFFAVCARVMRHIMVDLHRKATSQKRGCPQRPLPLDEERIAMENHADHLMMLHELMDQLKSIDERMFTITDLRFFTGMTVEEIAGLMNLSVSTIQRDWRKARGWLYQQIKESEKQ